MKEWTGLKEMRELYDAAWVRVTYPATPGGPSFDKVLPGQTVVDELAEGWWLDDPRNGKINLSDLSDDEFFELAAKGLSFPVGMLYEVLEICVHCGRPIKEAEEEESIIWRHVNTTDGPDFEVSDGGDGRDLAHQAEPFD